MKPDPILEECYRIKEEYSAQFKDVQSFFEHLKAQEKKRKKEGWKYAPPPQHLEFNITAEHLEFVIGRAKETGKAPQIVALLERLKTGLITCAAAKDSPHIDFGKTLQVETARALIQDWAIAAIRFVLKEDTDLQSETSPIAQEVRQILTAWLPDFVVLNFTLELSEDMQIIAKPIVGADTREGQAYLASAHLEIRMKRGEIPEGLTQILNRFKV
ncbi:hypothetical protein GBAR_LOCUS24820 [Geodia barretti]|uniref:Uncharacterized protein n=1 Tax=Geodia barretti TaxID=519541 RepID=A0AA35X5B9_GEOBA|nr:hypothetical protein GBAR_LOCUS24820 [Geodia barretti]